MKRIAVLAIAASLLAVTTASAFPHHHRHRVCWVHHHHRVCNWR